MRFTSEDLNAIQQADNSLSDLVTDFGVVVEEATLNVPSGVKVNVKYEEGPDHFTFEVVS